MPDYMEQSVRMDGPEVATIGAACREAGVAVCLGVSERAPDGSNTLFNSQFFWDKSGVLALVHRKLMPTFMERSVWSRGSAHTLRTLKMDAGFNLGGLICWEHTMPLARQEMANQIEQVSVRIHATAAMTGF